MGENRRYIKDDLIKIREAYRIARKECIEIQNGIEAENLRWRNEENRGWRNNHDYEVAKAKHNEIIRELREKLDEVTNKAKTDFATIKEDACKFFDRRFGVVPEALDVNALELLKSDILTDDELRALADSYSNNVTMKRIIGKYVIDRGNATDDFELKALGRSLTKVSNPHREALDSFIFWSESSLQGEKVRSDFVADHYEAETDRIIRESENVFADV